MSEPSPYSDLRQEFFQSFFEKALPYDEYLEAGEEKHRQRWRELESSIVLTPEHVEALSSFTRKMNVLVMSGIWCGDCVRQGPMLRAIEQAAEPMQFRFIDNRDNPELQNELKINGAQKVPVVVVFSEDFYELARFGDRHLSVYRKKAMTELGPACDAGLTPARPEDLTRELGEWVNFFERLQLILRLAPMLRKRYND